MKRRLAHGATFLLIIALAIFTVATSVIDDTIANTVSLETQNDNLYIMIKTRSDPKQYQLYAEGYWILYKSSKERQNFYYFANDYGQYMTRTYDDEDNKIDEILMDKPFFRTYTNKNFFIIEMPEIHLRHDDYYINKIWLLHDRNDTAEAYGP